jgi:uncharacterized phosphosugar-binding protein
VSEPRSAETAERVRAVDGGVLTAGAAYQDRVQAVLATALREEARNVRRAAEVVATTFSAGGVLYIFGSGHSHMFAEEAFYRAGGAVRVCPVLKPPYMLHEGAEQSTRLERESGHAEEVLAGYHLQGGRDCMIVASNSGVNALPVEVAQAARSRGLPVVAITSLAYARSVQRPGTRLYEVADVVVDNHCPPGDALIEVASDLPRMGPASTVVGLFLLNSILLAAAEEQLAAGSTPEIYLSANMPGAKDGNTALSARLRQSIPHL